jgi:hypothetical protein
VHLEKQRDRVLHEVGAHVPHRHPPVPAVSPLLPPAAFVVAAGFLPPPAQAGGDGGSLGSAGREGGEEQMVGHGVDEQVHLAQAWVRGLSSPRVRVRVHQRVHLLVGTG